MRYVRLRVVAAVCAAIGCGACVPYTVATTAQPLAQGESATTLVTYAMPKVGRIDSSRHSRSAPISLLASDMEWRMGIDSRSDAGIRVTSASGLVLNYKRLLTDTAGGTRISVIPGAGLVNMGQHAHFELTLVASRRETAETRFVPYAGLRVLQVLPVVEEALHDRPTAGGFIGARIGTLDLGVSPELGLFYDHSALGVRKSTVVFVPAISLHGTRLLDMIRGRSRSWSTEPREPATPPTFPAGPTRSPATPRTFPAGPARPPATRPTLPVGSARMPAGYPARGPGGIFGQGQP